MDGVIHKNNLKEIKQCMKNVDNFSAEIEEIIRHFSEGTMFGIMEGIKLLAELMKTVPEAMKQC